MTKKKLPTDLDILEAIYDLYYEDFLKLQKTTRLIIVIDLERIAKKLNTDHEIVLAMLFSHLEPLYKIKEPDYLKNILSEEEKHLFFVDMETKEYKLNFPHAMGILASLRAKEKKYKYGIIISLISLAIAIGSMMIAIFFA